MGAKLIVFEGVNRAGKTTQAKLLYDFFSAAKAQGSLHKRAQPGSADPFENDAFQQKLRAAYIELPKILNENFEILAGARSIKEIHSDIRNRLVYI